MAKVRFLQSTILISEGKVLNFNDELEIKDEKFVKQLAKDGLVDVLKEEKTAPKSTPKRKKQPQKVDEKAKEDGEVE